MINPDRLTVKATEALNEAIDLARRAGNPLVYDLHLLLALLTQDEGIVVPILQKHSSGNRSDARWRGIQSSRTRSRRSLAS
jgi:ATP-dependent Clp protease ATP-binding subunit ClpA